MSEYDVETKLRTNAARRVYVAEGSDNLDFERGLILGIKIGRDSGHDYLTPAAIEWADKDLGLTK